MPNADLASLNQRFGIPRVLEFAAGPGGLAMARIRNRHAEASVVLQGAHLTRWVPCGIQPVIWLSPNAVFAAGKAIRGGVPVCWPWFGAHPTEPSFPAHGFARTVLWDVIDAGEEVDGATRLVLSLPSDAAPDAWWPYATPVELHLRVGLQLEMELIVRNADSVPVTVSQALHSYFAVGDVGQVRISGLDGCSYLDKLDGGQRKRQERAVAISGEIDRIYLDATADCCIEDPVLHRVIRIAKRGSTSTVIWNPWQEKAVGMSDLGEGSHAHMVCVETANAGPDMIELAPGDEHRLWTRYSVEEGT